VWDLATRKPLVSIVTWDDNIALSPDGKRLAAVGRDKDTLQVWDAATGEELRTMKSPKGAAYSIAFSPDGTRLTTAGGGYGLVQVWDAVGGKVLLTIETDFNVADVAFSPDGTRLAAGGMTGLKLWDAATGQELASLPTRARMVNSVAFSPDGKLLAAGGSWDRQAEVWDLATGRRLFTVRTGGVTRLTFSPDGRWLVTASWDDRGGRSLGDTVEVWEAATGRQLLNLQGKIEEVHSVALSPDGTRLAAGDRDGTVRVWQVADP
jgi:WD40 repeat protein